MNSFIKKIAVDLTPVLPGGTNGGAKVFVLELLSELADMLPEVHFILLTQMDSHEALNFLERTNMQRVVVLGHSAKHHFRLKMASISSRSFMYFSDRISRYLNRIGFGINTWLKRGKINPLLKTMNIDLLFCPFTAPTYYESGIPTVCTIYDLQYKTFPQFFNPQDLFHRNFVFFEACKKATKLTAISHYSRDSAIKHGRLNPDKITTIHLRMANRLTSQTIKDDGILSQFGLIPGEFFIYPANSWQHKNHEMLLTAFAMLRHQLSLPNLKLICTGAYDERQQQIIEAARRMKLNEYFYFPNYLSSDELSVLMKNACALIFPSLYEGFGLPVIEAMAAGVPVACSNTTSLPEIAGDAALLFDPQNPTALVNAMQRLLTDNTLRTTLIEKGYQHAKKFASTRQMAQEYWDLFQAAYASDVQHAP